MGHTAGLGSGRRRPQHQVPFVGLAPVPCPWDSDARSCWQPSPGQTLAWGRLNARVGTGSFVLSHKKAGGGTGQNRSFRDSQPSPQLSTKTTV